MKVAIYARVSTDKQDELNQIPSLRAMADRFGAEIVAEYSDIASGRSKSSDRPGFSAMMKDAREGKFDAIMVVKLDRVMRSLKQLLNLLEELDKYNIQLISGDLGLLDLKSPVGKLQLQIVGAIAEWEAGIISERTKVALAAKKARGVVLGRPRTNNFDVETAAKLKLSGHTRKQICQKLGITIYQYNNRRREIHRAAEQIECGVWDPETFSDSIDETDVI